MLNLPEVSVIIAVYNGAAYLAEAIESVLAQTGPRLELIVVDDGSTDDTARISKSYVDRVIYCYQENRGQAAARNVGLELALAPLVAFIDADDIWTLGKLTRQMEILNARPDVDMVFGQVELFHSPELDDRRKQELKGHGQILAGYSGGTLLARKSVFDRVGYFRMDIQVGEFIDWYARIKDAGLKSVMIEEVLMKRRLHNSNMGVVFKDRRHEYLQVVKNSLDRRRAR